jgi:hypothetical protein
MGAAPILHVGFCKAAAHRWQLWVETGNRRNRAALDPTRIGIKRDDALVSLNADLDQNIDPEVTQRGRNLDA